MADLKKKPRRGTGRVAFLAHLEGIKKMIEAGHPLVSVYEEYETKLNIKSGQFGKYVRKYVKGDSSKKKEIVIKKEKAPSKEGFKFDPKSKEDLY